MMWLYAICVSVAVRQRSGIVMINLRPGHASVIFRVVVVGKIVGVVPAVPLGSVGGNAVHGPAAAAAARNDACA